MAIKTLDDSKIPIFFFSAIFVWFINYKSFMFLYERHSNFVVMQMFLNVGGKMGILTPVLECLTKLLPRN